MSRKLLPWLTTVLSVSLIALAALPAGALRQVSTAPNHPAGIPAQHAAAQTGYGQVPLAFEANEGQTNGAVRFLAHGNGYTLFLTPGAAVLSLRQGAAPARGQMDMGASARLDSMAPTNASAQTLGMRWLGANPHPVVTGEDPLPGTVNYFIGNDPAQWHTHIPTYQQVRYHDVYPGVDLVYYGNGGQLEYDFVVAPGADPAHIHLGFSGASQVGVDLLGNLTLTLPGGALQQNQPAIYQTVNGARRMVAGGFALTANRQVGFALGAYNPRLPLVIDPSYKFSTYLGGSDSDYGHASIVVDSAGSAYIAGQTYSTDFPVVNAVQNVNAGSSDVFVSKFNAAGTALIYSTYLGGSQPDYESGLAVDNAGCAYVTGETNSGNFPVLNAFQSTMHDTYVTKLTADGTGLYYSTYLGGSSADFSGAIAVNGAGDAYVAGTASSTNFPLRNPIQAFNAGEEDAFVTELNSTGNGLIYSTYLGGSLSEGARGIALDSVGAAYVTGYTSSLNFPTTVGVVQPHMPSGGFNNAFIAKLSPTGSKLVYSTYLGGNNDDSPYNQASDSATGIAVDAAGNAYITGAAGSPDFPTTPGAFQTTYPGTCCSQHTFVSKLNAAASALIYSTFIAGSTYEVAEGIALDSVGNAYISGVTYSTDYPTKNPLLGAFGGGNQDAFVTELNATGSALLYSSYLGGTGDEFASSIVLNAGRDVYVVGGTVSTNFPVKNALQSTLNGPGDAFVTKMRLWPSVDTTTGVFRPSNGVLYLKNANTTGPADVSLYYGKPGDQPITGDWTGKGYKSIGIYRNGTFYLRNSNTTGFADITVAFGASSDIPVAGDWTGKGYDSVGVYRPSNSTFYLRNSNTSGPPDIAVTLGISGDVPLVGDWTGKGWDSVGVFRPSNGIVYLRNSNTTGYADINFVYGIAGDKPVAGDWNADGVDTIGVDRGGNFLLRNSNTTGPADLSFYLGVSGDDPIAGPWLAPPGSVVSHGSPAPGRAPAAPRMPGAAVDRPRHAS